MVIIGTRKFSIFRLSHSNQKIIVDNNQANGSPSNSSPAGSSGGGGGGSTGPSYASTVKAATSDDDQWNRRPHGPSVQKKKKNKIESGHRQCYNIELYIIH